MGFRDSRIARCCAYGAGAAAVLTALPCGGLWADTLVYRGDNKWVAAEDNQALQGLLKAARGGKTHYRVTLPTAGRHLAIERLEIVKTLLEREAKTGVVMEEVGVAKVGTLSID